MTVISKLLKLMVKCTILERIECCLHRNMEIRYVTCESNWIKGKTSKYHVWQSQCLSLRSAHGIEPLQNDIQLTTLVLVHMQELHGSPKVWTWTWVVLMLALVATGANSYNNGATKFRKTCPCNSCRLLDQYVTTIKIEIEWPTLIASNHFFWTGFVPLISPDIFLKLNFHESPVNPSTLHPKARQWYGHSPCVQHGSWWPQSGLIQTKSVV